MAEETDDGLGLVKKGKADKGTGSMRDWQYERLWIDSANSQVSGGYTHDGHCDRSWALRGRPAAQGNPRGRSGPKTRDKMKPLLPTLAVLDYRQRAVSRRCWLTDVSPSLLSLVVLSVEGDYC